MLGFTLALLSLEVHANAGAHAEHALFHSVLLSTTVQMHKVSMSEAAVNGTMMRPYNADVVLIASLLVSYLYVIAKA